MSAPEGNKNAKKPAAEKRQAPAIYLRPTTASREASKEAQDQADAKLWTELVSSEATPARIEREMMAAAQSYANRLDYHEEMVGKFGKEPSGAGLSYWQQRKNDYLAKHRRSLTCK